MGGSGIKVLGGAIAVVSVAIVMRPSPPWDGLSKCELVDYAFQTFRHEAGADTLREFIENGVAIDVGPSRGSASFHIVLGKPRMVGDAKKIYLDFNRWTGGISFHRIDSNADVIRERSAEYAECI